MPLAGATRRAEARVPRGWSPVHPPALLALRVPLLPVAPVAEKALAAAGGWPRGRGQSLVQAAVPWSGAHPRSACRSIFRTSPQSTAAYVRDGSVLMSQILWDITFMFQSRWARAAAAV